MEEYMLKGMREVSPIALSQHAFKKGRFISPFNDYPGMKELEDYKSWAYGRMPEYLWIGLILKHFGRDVGLRICRDILSKLHDLEPELSTARLSQIIKMNKNLQKQFYDFILRVGAKEALAPLTVFLTTSKAPVFAEYFYTVKQSISDRCEALTAVMRDVIAHQSNEATDIRFLVFFFWVLSGKLVMPKEELDLLLKYPVTKHSDPIMHLIRPEIRAIEVTLLICEEADTEYIDEFWRTISEMTECSILYIRFPEENRDITGYLERLHDAFSYLSELFVATDPLDEKMRVLLGIATFSYKRLKEMHDHRLFNSIVGRSEVRVLIENYIMMRYLVKNEVLHENIWREYQFYGIGAYKLVLSRYRDRASLEKTHFDKKYIEILVNEFKDEEFIDMDTRYFDQHNIRTKADAVGEKDLYGLYYDYDSSYEHGLWGAIRESSLLKCNNPAHKYHCVPDVDDEIRLKTVLPDCIMIMNKTVSFLNDVYGIPEKILNEVLCFEVKPDNE